MTYITIKNDHTLGARFLLLIVRLLGRNTADVAANRVLPNPPPEFEDWWDDTRSAQEIIADIKGYQTGAV